MFNIFEVLWDIGIPAIQASSLDGLRFYAAYKAPIKIQIILNAVIA